MGGLEKRHSKLVHLIGWYSTAYRLRHWVDGEDGERIHLFESFEKAGCGCVLDTNI